jgi:hypothetical protein
MHFAAITPKPVVLARAEVASAALGVVPVLPITPARGLLAAGVLAVGFVPVSPPVNPGIFNPGGSVNPGIDARGFNPANPPTIPVEALALGAAVGSKPDAEAPREAGFKDRKDQVGAEVSALPLKNDS